MDSVRAAIDAAGRTASRAGTKELRRNAASAGWSREAIRDVKVKYKDAQFDVEIGDTAAHYEYGTGSTVPAPAARQYINRPADTEDALIKAVEKKLKGLL
jgi:hypothetical protein